MSAIRVTCPSPAGAGSAPRPRIRPSPACRCPAGPRRAGRSRGLERGRAVVRDVHVVPREPEQHAEALGGIALSSTTRIRRRQWRNRSVGAVPGRLAAPAGRARAAAGGPRTRCPARAPRCGPDAAAVHLDQAPHQRQADAQPALRRSGDAVDLREQLEDAAAASRPGCRCRCPCTDTDDLAVLAARRSARSCRPARCTWRRC